MVVAMVAVLGVGAAGRAGASEGQFAGLVQSMAGQQILLLFVQPGKRGDGLLGSGAAVLSQHSTHWETVQGAATGMKGRGATAGGGYIHEAHSNKMTQAWGTSQSRPHGFANVPTRIERSSGQSCKSAVSSPAALLTQSAFAAHLPIVRLRRVSRSLMERALAISLITPTLVKLHLTMTCMRDHALFGVLIAWHSGAPGSTRL
jgi:hypothetical protein